MLTNVAFGYITWIIIGAVAGWFATVLYRTKIHQALVFDVLLGILGALFGGVIFTSAAIEPATINNSMIALARFFPAGPVFSPWSLMAALFGAIALLGLLRLFPDIRLIPTPH